MHWNVYGVSCNVGGKICSGYFKQWPHVKQAEFILNCYTKGLRFSTEKNISQNIPSVVWSTINGLAWPGLHFSVLFVQQCCLKLNNSDKLFSVKPILFSTSIQITLPQIWSADDNVTLFDLWYPIVIYLAYCIYLWSNRLFLMLFGNIIQMSIIIIFCLFYKSALSITIKIM